MENIFAFLDFGNPLFIAIIGGLIDLVIRNIPTKKRTSLIAIFTKVMQLLDVVLDKLLGQKVKLNHEQTDGELADHNRGRK
jgi:hypothetical protein